MTAHRTTERQRDQLTHPLLGHRRTAQHRPYQHAPDDVSQATRWQCANGIASRPQSDLADQRESARTALVERPAHSHTRVWGPPAAPAPRTHGRTEPCHCAPTARSPDSSRSSSCGKTAAPPPVCRPASRSCSPRSVPDSEAVTRTSSQLSHTDRRPDSSWLLAYMSQYSEPHQRFLVGWAARNYQTPVPSSDDDVAVPAAVATANRDGSLTGRWCDPRWMTPPVYLQRVYGRRPCSTSVTPPRLSMTPALWRLSIPTLPRESRRSKRRWPRPDWLGCERLEAPPATESELELAHTAAHVRAIRELCASGGGQVDNDTFVGEASYRAALHAAGGACAMVRALIAGDASSGFCAVRPSGHHAGRDSAMGFCLFNNVAIAAELAIRALGIRKALVLDWDVHHGNGTGDIFRRRSDVLFASIHQSGLFPGTGRLSDAGSGDGLGYTINIPVEKGSEEEVWLSVLEHVIVPVGLEFQPELVLISAGFDAHRADPLGGCSLDAASFARMACHVREMAADVAAPVGAVLEGGYDPGALAESALATIAALGGAGTAESAAPDPLVTSRVAAHVGHFWTL